MTPEQLALLEWADDTLDTARIVQAHGKHRHAISRAYYAMLYAAQALLESSPGGTFRKHQAVLGAVGKHWVQTGKLEPEYHRWFNGAFDTRGKVDYYLGEVYTHDDSELHIVRAAAFINRIREILNQQTP